MDYLKMFYDLLEEYRVQFDLKYHMHSGYGTTLIEVWSGGCLAVHVTDEDYDYCHRRAYEDLEYHIRIRKQKINAIMNDFRSRMKENA